MSSKEEISSLVTPEMKRMTFEYDKELEQLEMSCGEQLRLLREFAKRCNVGSVPLILIHFYVY